MKKATKGKNALSLGKEKITSRLTKAKDTIMMFAINIQTSPIKKPSLSQVNWYKLLNPIVFYPFIAFYFLFYTLYAISPFIVPDSHSTIWSLLYGVLGILATIFLIGIRNNATRFWLCGFLFFQISAFIILTYIVFV